MEGAKEMFMEIRIKAEMSEDTFRKIPSEVKEEMKIKSIEALNFREIYKKDALWKTNNKELSEAIQRRSKREDIIRSEHK